MAFVFNFPDVGEGIHEGRVVEWLVAEGETVAEDQPLLKVETDKAVVELPSPARRDGARSSTSPPTPPSRSATRWSPSARPARRCRRSSRRATPHRRRGTPPPPVEAAAPASGRGSPTAAGDPAHPRAGAQARRRSGDVQGSGSGGRITDEDVERAAEDGARVRARTDGDGAPPAGVSRLTVDGEVERVPVTHLRKVIADAMRDSKQISAHVTHVDEADVTDLIEHYRTVKAGDRGAHGGPLHPAAVLHQGPGDGAQGLPDLQRQRRRGARGDPAQEVLQHRHRGRHPRGTHRAGDQGRRPQGHGRARRRDRRSRPSAPASASSTLDELKGGTCTITNIGPLGGVFATPIINQPELAIVGLHKIQERPVVVDGEIVIRKMMYLSISFDHRYDRRRRGGAIHERSGAAGFATRCF